MNTEHELKLFNDFPKLYAGKDLPLSENLMSFGFSCGDGWFDIIYDLSKEINDLCKNIDPYPITVLQVKEKFGSLRYYYNVICDDDNLFNKIEEFILNAEKRSNKTCEECGKFSGSKTQINGWVSNLCEKCLETRR